MCSIHHLDTAKLEKVFAGRKDYSIKEIDEMRRERAKFIIMDIINEDNMY
ncbi:uncharacterized protein M6B38_385290 [Iris pallida]|uniref:Uncharacterized protein n=1 Tax=Iris pallida TaxID=29817 RepID=A0AAX6G3X2_IRIPA|nr:uncharacterized protein M6B38_385290 [Iris pallida]